MPQKSFTWKYWAVWSAPILKKYGGKCPKKRNKKEVLPENIEQFGQRQCQNQDQFELQPLVADLAQSWSSKTSLEEDDMISGCMDMIMIMWGYDMDMIIIMLGYDMDMI